jgi:hypothetical protein
MSRSPQPQGAPCVYAYKGPRPCSQKHSWGLGFLFRNHRVESAPLRRLDRRASSVTLAG